ncbi:MAG: hypothetical protein OEV91_06670, partial [Desulfobulbaceae bacterium]|nr:hypothetical protein [Desulfobulbaceae bacterium]HIJ91725.1 hypothetical protein [Deltaproteobacteria bacterium]
DSARMLAYEAAHPGYSPGAASASLGPDGGETRALFDDVDDYDGSAEANANFFDQNGAQFTMQGYGRTVQVCYIASNLATINNAIPCAGASTDTKRIVVTVTTPGGETFRFTAVRCNL